VRRGQCTTKTCIGECHLSKAKFWPLDIHGEGLHLDGDAMVKPNIKPGLCPMRLQRTARLLTLAMVLVTGSVFDWPNYKAHAQQAQQDYRINPDSLPTRRRPKLTDVWGPPKMPPTPKDFGPHFDFPAGGSTNMTCGPGYQYFCGAPSQAPYPN
jgi:hypothetical protein